MSRRARTTQPSALRDVGDAKRVRAASAIIDLHLRSQALCRDRGSGAMTGVASVRQRGARCGPAGASASVCGLRWLMRIPRGT